MKTAAQLYKVALGLSVFTIIYNMLEGAVSVIIGAIDETLTLFGFGLDSIIEVVSGAGILIMIYRTRNASGVNKSKGEITALKITGYSFYVLIVLLVVSSILALVTKHRPVTTLWGIVISGVSIIVMLILARLKITTGQKLGSKAIISDGKCTMVCVYMSLVLLLSSLLYRWTNIGYLDVLGSLALCWFCYSEGKEALENARNVEKEGCC